MPLEQVDQLVQDQLGVQAAAARLAVQLASVPPPDPKQDQVVEPPWAGKAGLAGLTVPTVQNA